jgi:UDP-GlcNAc:undecaprenyl-phosphate/decaprenyl-phosphate GlcNAc-1-phosphate transferase
VNPIPWLLLAFGVAAGATFGVAVVAERYGRRLGVLDVPRPGEVQRWTVPRTGGYAMLIGLWLALLVGYLLRSRFLVDPDIGPVWNPDDDMRVLGLVLGSVCIVPLAILDDRRRLAPLPQLVGQLLIACVPVAFGLRVNSIAQPFGDPIDLPIWLNLPISVLWFVGMMNAINWVDNMDGLAGGLAFAGALVLFARAFLFTEYSVALFPLVLGGVCLGFLGRNRPPARIFMGSAGSLLLGFGLAGSGILGGAKLGTAILVLGVPILDAAWVIFRRITRGARPTIGGDREHLPMKLHDLGLTTGQTVFVLYVVSAILGVVGLSLHTPPEAPSIDKLYALVGMALVVLVVLAALTVAVTRRRA